MKEIPAHNSISLFYATLYRNLEQLKNRQPGITISIEDIALEREDPWRPEETNERKCQKKMSLQMDDSINEILTPRKRND